MQAIGNWWERPLNRRISEEQRRVALKDIGVREHYKWCREQEQRTSGQT